MDAQLDMACTSAVEGPKDLAVELGGGIFTGLAGSLPSGTTSVGVGGTATSDDILPRLLGNSEFGAVSKVEAPSSVSTSILALPEELPVVLVVVEVVASPV